jgi:hypothetical protein
MIENLISKSSFNWNFKEDDWFVDLILNDTSLRFKIFTLKNYSSTSIDSIVYEASTKIVNYRSKLEQESKSFLTKKSYLLKHSDDDKIQISLEDEYRLKDLIEKYKLYELIGWVHLGKNEDVFKHCVLEKQKILNQLYPMIDTSIRKVIGSKVIDVKQKKNHDLFDEAVNNAWMAIIKYLTKIDTSKVMFSVLVATAQRSAIFLRSKRLEDAYNTVRINDLVFTNDEATDEDVSEDTFVNTVISNNEALSTNNYVEDELIDNIDNDANIQNYYELNNNNNSEEIDDILNEIDNPDRTNVLQQNILAHSFDILSGKIKKICFEKIFAEFFFDLINNKIPEKTIVKHTPVLIEIMNLVAINPDMVNDFDKNNETFKLFRSWIKEKAKTKLIQYNINIRNKGMSEVKIEQLETLTKREKAMLDYLKENKKDTLVKLIKFKNDCINFNTNSKE